jgi:SAM-dependent methyltransferase
MLIPRAAIAAWARSLRHRRRPSRVQQCAQGALEPSAAELDAARIGGGDYASVGQEFLEAFKVAGLKPTDVVLEIGCGIGRMAVSLATWLRPPGRYNGFDVVHRSVEWCQTNVSSRWPDFRFHHADVRNGFYNPGGDIQPEVFAFPSADSSCDFVIAVSVFTHLLPSTTSHYVLESARALRVGGRMYSTWFVWPADRPETPARDLFPIDRGIHRIGSASDPEAVVCYEESFIRRVHANAGLRIQRVERGNWSRGEHRMPYQDTVIATKERLDSTALT